MDGTIPAAFAATVAARPGAEAVVAGAERLTWADLDAQVRLCGRGLLAAGIGPGDRVAVWAPNGIRWVVAALGTATVGGTLVPVSTRLTGPEAAHVLAATRAAALLVDRTFLATDRLAALRAAAAAGDGAGGDGAGGDGAAPDAAPAGRPPVPGLPWLRLVVGLDADNPDWAALLEGAGEVDPAEVDRHAGAVRPGDPSDVLFTSGTTGRPKGVVVTHGQSVRAYRTWADVVGLRAGDRYLAVNPFSHSFGLKAGILACVLTGATLLPLPVFTADAAWDLIEAERVTVLPGPPTLYTSLLDSPRRGATHLRLAVTGAAVVPPALIARMRSELGFAEVLTAYGLAESSGVVTMCRRGDPPELVSATSGRAVDGVTVEIVRPDGSRPPAGEAGEVVVRGYPVMAGYLDDPAATAEAVDPDGWLHTGDIGVLDAAGNLTITDRLKDMYTVGGFNAYPAEVERVLAEHPAVSVAAVVGLPDDRLGEVGRAFVVPRPGATPTEAELTAFCRERLANYKIPRSVVFVDALPLNGTGKVDKPALRSRIPRRPGASAR